jgi:hypothetical protein
MFHNRLNKVMFRWIAAVGLLASCALYVTRVAQFVSPGLPLTLDNRQPAFSAAVSTRSASSKVACSLHQCMIENACIDSTLKWFKHGPRYNIRLLGTDQEILEEMQRRFLNAMGTRDTYILHAEPVNWNNESTVPNALPIELHSNTSTAITSRFVPRNCGHELGDGVFPIFRLLRTFENKDTHLTDIYINSKLSIRCGDNLFNGLLERRTAAIHVLHKRPKTTQCYGRIYAGVKGIGFMSEGGVSDKRLPTLQADMAAFRDAMYDNLQVRKPNSVNRVLVMNKKAGIHMCKFGNLNGIVATIQSNFPSYNVSVVSWSDYGLKDQLELLRSTKVMVSLPGADVLNAIFMPNQSMLMMFCRQRQSNPKTPIHYDSNYHDHWFRHVSHIQTVLEDCNSTGVSYNWTARTTTVDLEHLNQVLSAHAASTS